MNPLAKRKAGLFSQQFGAIMRTSKSDLAAVQATLEDPNEHRASGWLGNLLKRPPSSKLITRYKLDYLLSVGEWYGALEILPVHGATCTFRHRRVQAYRVHCKCDRQTWMPASMIVARWAEGVGCGHDECVYSRSVVMATDPVEAVLFQLRRLAAFNGGAELENEWGGSCYETLDSESIESAALRIVSEFTQDQRDEYRWWMYRSEDWRPYGPDSVEWRGGIEDPFLLGLMTDAALGQATAEDLASALRLDLEFIRRHMAAGLSGDALIDQLLEAQGKH